VQQIEALFHKNYIPGVQIRDFNLPAVDVEHVDALAPKADAVI
jgi:hypothetical protein